MGGFHFCLHVGRSSERIAHLERLAAHLRFNRDDLVHRLDSFVEDRDLDDQTRLLDRPPGLALFRIG